MRSMHATRRHTTLGVGDTIAVMTAVAARSTESNETTTSGPRADEGHSALPRHLSRPSTVSAATPSRLAMVAKLSRALASLRKRGRMTALRRVVEQRHRCRLQDGDRDHGEFVESRQRVSSLLALNMSLTER